jgi:prevent-host-death family protein
MYHMKTISLRELRHNTGKWMRRVAEEQEITITDRGVIIAKVIPPKRTPRPKNIWANRPLVPGYAEYLRTGKMGTDSTPGISADRALRD